MKVPSSPINTRDSISPKALTMGALRFVPDRVRAEMKPRLPPLNEILPARYRSFLAEELSDARQDLAVEWQRILQARGRARLTRVDVLHEGEDGFQGG